MNVVALSESDRLLLQALLERGHDGARAAGAAYLERVDLQRIPWSQQRLLPLLYQRLTAFGMSSPALVRGTYRRAWAQNQLRFRAVAVTMAQLDAAGIANVVLKGASLVPAYGGDWGVRDMSDVDLLVPRADVYRTADLLAAGGWRPRLGGDVAGALARVVDRRHSWAFEHAGGHQIDLHWHVLETSRGPASDAAFLADAVPLALGSVTARRLCDADLLLHVLEHGTHGEEMSQLQWIVDAVHVMRSLGDPSGAAARLRRQADQHRLVDVLQQQLGMIVDALGEPAALALRDSLDTARRRRAPQTVTVRGRFDEFRRGGTPALPAARAMVRETLDLALVRRPVAWAVYAAAGRCPSAERALTRRGGPSTAAPTMQLPPCGPDGWWDAWRPEVADAVCGPGWWYCEPDAQGVWTEGAEARLSIPLGGRHVAAVELQLSVLGRHGGPTRRVSVRAAGRTRAMLEAPEGHSWHEVSMEVDARHPTAELSVRIDQPARPTDLGLPRDPRRLGAMLHRFRLR